MGIDNGNFTRFWWFYTMDILVFTSLLLGNRFLKLEHSNVAATQLIVPARGIDPAEVQGVPQPPSPPAVSVRAAAPARTGSRSPRRLLPLSLSPRLSERG